MHPTRFTLLVALTLGSLAGCASEEAAADWTPADGETADLAVSTDFSAEALSIGGGGGGYACDDSRCTCTPLVDCDGMNDYCFERGKSITCTFPPDATPECHCDLTVQRPRVRLIAAPTGTATATRR